MIWDGTEHRSGLKRRSGNYLTIGWFEGEIGRGHQISVPERREFADRRFMPIEDWEKELEKTFINEGDNPDNPTFYLYKIHPSGMRQLALVEHIREFIRAIRPDGTFYNRITEYESNTVNQYNQKTVKQVSEFIIKTLKELNNPALKHLHSYENMSGDLDKLVIAVHLFMYGD